MKEELLKGSQKIMFSAPHCVDHFRKGILKIKEINTDVLVKELNKRKNTPCIYKVESNLEDANWDLNSPYKEKCKKYIKENNILLFIDIHGMDYKRNEDICIGTANGKNLSNYKEVINTLRKIFAEYGYENVRVDKPFSADNSRCISRYINKECGIDTLQIEINNKYRFSDCKEYDMENLICCFEKIIETLKS